MRVAAVVLHYRYWPEMRSALDALMQQSQPAASITVVDNDSGDGALSEIRSHYPSVQVVANPRNSGYAGGMNLGARSVTDADAILFLTHEVVLASGALEVLTRELEEHPAVAVTGPVLGLLDARERTWSAGGGLGRRTGRPYHHESGRLLEEVSSEGRRSVRWLDGAALLVRRTAFEHVGGFDEGYFLYDEEVDLALRLARAGWDITCVPAAQAWQRPAMAPPYLATRNRLRLLARNPGMRRFLPAAVLLLVLDVLSDLMHARDHRTRRRLHARLLGACDAVSGQLRLAWTVVR